MRYHVAPCYCRFVGAPRLFSPRAPRPSPLASARRLHQAASVCPPCTKCLRRYYTALPESLSSAILSPFSTYRLHARFEPSPAVPGTLWALRRVPCPLRTPSLTRASEVKPSPQHAWMRTTRPARSRRSSPHSVRAGRRFAEQRERSAAYWQRHLPILVRREPCADLRRVRVQRRRHVLRANAIRPTRTRVRTSYSAGYHTIPTTMQTGM